MIVIILGFSLQAEVLKSQNPTCNPNDLRGLNGLMTDLESSQLNWNTNLSTSNCCNWLGITCNSSSGRVIKLQLGRLRLMGKLSNSLSSLDQLKTLNLSNNLLRGPLPNSLLHLPNLEVLDLTSNYFTGFFPISINLPSVRKFDISENRFGGSVPLGICYNSTRVQFMDLGFNDFLGNLTQEIGYCTSLEHLCLRANNLSGELPENLFRLTNLTQLALQDNRFSGQLSRNIGYLSKLVHLDVSFNMFSGNIPDVFHGFRKLTYFSAQSNNFTGHIPNSLSNSHTIASLSLRNNSLGGPLSLNCSAMTNLVSLDLGSNQFSGPIPDNLPSCPRLQTVNLGRNNLPGQIPESFMNFHSLSSFSVSNCSVYNLSSALQILQHCKNLTTLVLTLNFHNEELPYDPSLQFKSLKTLVIANCRLTGIIPPWLSHSTQLQLLDLSWNRLGGTIPASLGNFQFLFYLDLSNNSLTGEIPHSLTRLQSLKFRNISWEEPSPIFPFFMRRNATGGVLQYNRIWSFPPMLDLSSNSLTGPIWPEFGDLKRIHILDLKCNNLSGNIPDNLSGMTSIETLDLSDNNLSGNIPPSLVNLSFLSKFSVAYNNLSGDIPTGGQFQTFSTTSFEGNIGLCGNHASPCENRDPASDESVRKTSKNKSTIIAMAAGIGIGTVFLLALMFLIVIRATTRKASDFEREGDGDEKDLEEIRSTLVVLFQSKEHDKELFLDDLLTSTNSFDQANIIGCGGFGLVYKATLPDGKKVAIKRLSGDCGQMEREFQAEVEALSMAQHPNLVHLQGCCKYKSDRLLIYSYMENGSLDYWLHEKLDGPSLLDWDARLQIAKGAARGLAYLHQSCEPHILHRDIKSSNILLDENFEAHLADFGLARLMGSPYDTHVTTDLVGTLGYIPPEYCQASVATYKGDVYSFGVVLLELLTGKRPMDMCKPRGCRDLISRVLEMRREKRESEVFDPFIYNKDRAKEMLLVLEIACLCLSESPKIRPSTQQLVSWLDNIDVKV